MIKYKPRSMPARFMDGAPGATRHYVKPALPCHDWPLDTMSRNGLAAQIGRFARVRQKKRKIHVYRVDSVRKALYMTLIDNAKKGTDHGTHC